jgi:hypothetical protein
MNKFFEFKLRNAPVPAKVLCVGYLFSLSVGYLYALMNVVLVVGLAPDQIALHYYGSTEKINKTAVSKKEEEFSLEDQEPAPPAVVQPGIKKFVAEGHFHLFGMTSFFFGLTLLALFTGVSLKLKSILVGAPYAVIVIDNLSFITTRLLGPSFSYLTAVAGTLMALSFTSLFIVILFEVFQPVENQKRTP